MSFDWQAFLDKQGIEYVTRGPSTSRGNLYIHCPFCGDADEGRHMGVSIENKGWGCWRNQAHRGRAPQRLIQALLGCSWAEAATIIGKKVGGSLWGSEDAIGQMLAGFEKQDISAPPKLELMADFRSIMKDKMFRDYMSDRGFSKQHIRQLAEEFNLLCARTGPYTYRIILPIYDEDKNLVTWTGRAINDDAKIRYKTCSYRSPGRPPPYGPEAHGPITDYLFDLPNLYEGGKFLVIVEGPFDALRLTLGAKKWKARLTCLFGKAVSPAQLDHLADLSDLYDAMFLMLDPEASADTLQLSQQLAAVNVVPIFLQGEHDPGAFTPEEVAAVFDEMFQAAHKGIRPFANSGGMP